MHVALIDDDSAVLDSLRLYFKSKGIAVSGFASADSFLKERKQIKQLDCIVADVRMPGLSGLDLVRYLATESSSIPVILITGHGDIDMAVTAIRQGAFDFIEKPFDEERLLQSIRDAVSQSQQKRDALADLADLNARAESLTERQREVMDLAVTGMSNREIATRLAISPRTVEIHRAWMMERMGARNLAELVRMGMLLKQKS
jgi:two-component system response regulator FixJ